MNKKTYLHNYYLKNKEKIKNRSRNYHWKHRNEIIKKQKERYKRNFLERKIVNKKWISNNRKRWLNYQKWYNIHRREKDPNFNMRHRLRSRLNVVFKKYGNGKIFPSNKYGIDYFKIIEHLKPFPKDISKYHIDHIIPLVSFDLTDPEQIKIAFAPENHQWLLAEENRKKGGLYGN
jgi:hypothetical protein